MSKRENFKELVDAIRELVSILSKNNIFMSDI